ncbi:hypothetical protein [Oryzihumus sp.]|uniref:hypothetical protein n=1 Tax=Oryzihumus sp. TaxID=1968903 RepID=UPI002ED90E8A
MKFIGYFRQLDHGMPDGPDLVEAVAVPLPEAEREPLASYLRAGFPLVVTGSLGTDFFAPERGEVSRINTLTDGEFLWPEDLAYYVETYGARPPAEFLEHVKAQGSPPKLDQDELATLTTQLRGY